MTTVRKRVPLALLAFVVVLGAACSSSKSNGSTGGTNTTTGGAKLAATTLKGSGSTFQDPFDEQVFQDFKKNAQPNVTVNYNAVGSGQGQTDLEGQLTDFAGSDSLVAATDTSKFKGGTFLYVPIVAAPITISYNLTGVSGLKLSAPTIAKIFSGKVTKWNDPAIAADNSGVNLPSTTITVVHRSDGSGTTNNFTSYLVSAAPSDWTLGSGKTVNWPTSTVGVAKSTGVANKIKSTSGAIGYVDFSDATATGLSFADVKNAAGTFITPSLAGATAAMAGAAVTADVTVTPMNAPGADSYPITSPTYIIVYEKQTNHDKGEALKALLNYILGPAQDTAASLDFAKLPAPLLAKAQAQVAKLQIP